MNGIARFRMVILAAASAMIFAGTALADKPAEKGKKQKPRQVLDTGVELVPADPSGEAALEQMTNRSSDGLTVVQHDNGMLSVDLEGRFMSVMMATPNTDGTHSLSCLTGSQARKHAAAGAGTVKAWRAQARSQMTSQLEEK
jgi:hypothetical protein